MATFPPPSNTESSPWINHQGSLPPEVDVEGNIEYKLKLVATAPDRFEHLVTQLKWRLSEGNGSAIYEIGVADNGSFVGLSPQDMDASLKTLQRMADFLKADVTILRKVSVESTQRHDTAEDGVATPGLVRRQLSAHSGSPRTRPEYLVVEAMVTSRLADEHHFLEIRVALVGGPDAGKSTLLGRLAHGIADNGRGKARLNLLRHRHEINTGRTSSISHEIMGFTATGETVNYTTTNISSWQEVCESSAKVVTLLDTCGHPRFLKTTIAGLTGHAPDYACLVVDSRLGGVNEMTKEHLALAVALDLPTFVTVTKMDVATRDQLRATVTALMILIRNTGSSCLPTVNGDEGPSKQPVNSSSGTTGDQPLQTFVPLIVRSNKELDAAVKRFSDSSVIQETNTVAIPILLLSSVTGENVNILERFLFLLPKPSLDSHDASYSKEPACYQIEEIYNIPDIGTVVGGFLHAGRIEVHNPGSASWNILDTDELQEENHAHNLYLGPVDRDGGFIPIVVKSIHRQRMSMRSIDSGQTATLAIEGVDLAAIKVRRGMVILESDTDPKGTCCRKFEAVIQVLGHDRQFGVGFQGMIHCGSVHQNARVTKIELIPGPDQQEGDLSLVVPDNAEDLGGVSNEPTEVRTTGRDTERANVSSSRSSSRSSDYGSGTGSSVQGSASVSRSTSSHLLADNVGSTDDQGSTVSEDQPQLQLRSRQRRHDRNKQHDMIPISTMRRFRKLSTKNLSEGSPVATLSAEEQPTLVDPEDDVEPVMLQAGSRAKVVFEFCHDVVFMREGTTVLFRHGRTKCVGKILRML
ncbi:hypothetical protein B0O80DRAFT_490073 [Mortierella sp. GBAus27b]|nr:hypothetical protein B0O80DRAFT_490073 [Mortierella sp. GBAus27b]